MGLLELFVIAVGLSMDAFAVSICKGLSVRELKPKHALTVGVYFGGFQMLMPLIGFALGVRFQSFITSIDHWIAFVLLGLIGANMIRESREQDEEHLSDSFSFGAMLPLAVATSIDALSPSASPSHFSRSAFSRRSALSARQPLFCRASAFGSAMCSGLNTNPARSCSAALCSSLWALRSCSSTSVCSDKTGKDWLPAEPTFSDSLQPPPARRLFSVRLYMKLQTFALCRIYSYE